MSDKLLQLTKLNENDKALFARALNSLFTGTFLLNQVEKDKPLYRFVLQNFELFEEYLIWAGWYLRKDENLGVLAFRGPAGARLSFSLEETLGLLVLRVLYEEKQYELNLSREKTVKQYEFQEKYKVLTERSLPKTRFVELLRRFKSLKLIQLVGEETDPDALLILYPSIAFALDGETIDDMYERIEKLKKTGPGEDQVELEPGEDQAELEPGEDQVELEPGEDQAEPEPGEE